MKSNYHTHCTYCDGKNRMTDFVKAAEETHFQQLGFSSHAPVPFENHFAIQEEKLPDYCNEIASLQKQTSIQLLSALECDFIPNKTTFFDHFRQKYHLDYIIGGVHLVCAPHSDELWFIDGSKREIYDDGLANFFQNNIKQAVTAFWEQTFEMLETEHLDIIAHLDKIKMHNQHRFFTENESWYTTLVDKSLSLIKQHNVIVELNSRGLYKQRCDSYYPSDSILHKMSQMQIPAVVSSDAHQVEELNAYYDKSIEKLAQFGVQLVNFDHGSWH